MNRTSDRDRPSDADHPARAIIHHLDEGEVIEWAGKPDRRDALRWGLVTWGFFLPWTAFCTYWLYGLGTGHGAGFGDPFALFCLAAVPFLVIGFGGLTLPLWLAHRADGTLHVITDQRELTFESGLLTRVVGRRVTSPHDDTRPFTEARDADVADDLQALLRRARGPRRMRLMRSAWGVSAWPLSTWLLSALLLPVLLLTQADRAMAQTNPPATTATTAAQTPASANSSGPTAASPSDALVASPRFRNLAAELRCLVCQNQTLVDSSAPLAQDLRAEVVRLMTEGRDDAQIKSYLVDRYGEFVLYRPALSARNALLWFGPFVLLAVGAFAWWRLGRRRRDTPMPATSSKAQLDRIDELLRR